MKAISIRQPWAWAILHAGKRIENRSWQTGYRGRVLIHASSWWQVDDAHADFQTVRVTAGPAINQAPPVSLNSLKAARGGIVGAATIIDCVSSSHSPWFFGPFGFVLDDVAAFPAIIPCKGALGFFEVPEAVERVALEALAA